MGGIYIMKILYRCVLVVMLFIFLAGAGLRVKNRKRTTYNNVYDSVFRFHVLANSDSDADQALKLKVKDAVVTLAAEDMKNAGVKSKSEAMEYMKNNSARYIETAKNVIRDKGYNYDVNVTIDKHWFPLKEYGMQVYPAGEYDAYRMLIGKAEGKNWWCVLYPSLCMIEDTRQNEPDNKSDNKSDNKYEIKFRFIEWLKQVW